MKFIDEYRESFAAQQVARAIRQLASKKWRIMEVCGGQTHSLLRHGIDSELCEVVELLHGPGCPVCVTPIEAVDAAIELARRPGILLASFGDMLRVPGSRTSLLGARTHGANVKLVYSPLDAISLAQKERDKQVVFFAVGFETTVPATALAVLQAASLGLDNFSLLCCHVRVQPAMEQLMQSPEVCIEGFLAAGHVCTVVGFESYQEFVERYRVPVVVTGFEPLDLLAGIYQCVDQLERRTTKVTNAYERSVRRNGNLQARSVIDATMEICDCPWRGLGMVAGGGLRLRSAFRRFDAREKFALSGETAGESICPSGEVMAGRLKPVECQFFGKACTPDSPLGAPMVSSEGTCAAFYRYRSTLA